MYTNVLIISDNLPLCKAFEKIILDLKLQHVNWTFSISPFSSLDSFIQALSNEVKVVNLKNDVEIDFICKNYSLVLSIHCKQIFPKKLVETVKCINIHPGYNPINRGWYPQVFAIINNSEVGATIHEIDAFLDHGKIIDREFVTIESWDTSLSLYEKITNLELVLLQKNLVNILSNSYNTIVPENEGSLYLKKDFNALCELDLTKQQSIQETLNLLRALTHGTYKNAYYIDPSSGAKIYVCVEFKKN
jgi:methionyl-tRNA formyltransferase